MGEGAAETHGFEMRHRWEQLLSFVFGKIVLATAHTKDGQGGGRGRVAAEKSLRTPRCSSGEMTDNQNGVGQRACVKYMGLGYILKRQLMGPDVESEKED